MLFLLKLSIDYFENNLKLTDIDTIQKEEKAMSLDSLLNCGYKKDFILNKILELLAHGVNYLKNFPIADYSVVNKKLHY